LASAFGRGEGIASKTPSHTALALPGTVCAHEANDLVDPHVDAAWKTLPPPMSTSSLAAIQK